MIYTKYNLSLIKFLQFLIVWIFKFYKLQKKLIKRIDNIL